MATDKPGLLITGAGGALAQIIIHELKPRYDIIGVDFQKRRYEDDSIHYYRLDFSKRGFEEVFINHKIDAVIHLGRILLYEWDRFRRYNTNVLGTQQLYDLSLKYGVTKTVFLSTFYVYGAHPYNPSLIDEMFPLKAGAYSANLSDAVELEYMSGIYLHKHPQLNLTILRPCNIVGPGVRNSMNMLLRRKYVPVLLGFSPVMQFIHVADLAEAIILGLENNHPGIYNVVSDDWIPYPKTLEKAGCIPIPIPSVPPALTRRIVQMLRIREFPDFLINYYKYPVILDGALFRKTFDFTPRFSMDDIFGYYLSRKPWLNRMASDIRS